jgi:hypothetical protein
MGLEKGLGLSDLLDVLFNKYLWLVLLIYVAPTILFLAYIFYTTPTGSGYQGGLTTDYSPMFESIFGLIVLIWIFIYFPMLAVQHLAFGWIIIPYFIVAYGLLYWYYRREETKKQTKKSERTREQDIKEAPGDHL